MRVNTIISISIFPLLLLLAKEGMASQRTNNYRVALRRYREVRDLNGIVFPITSSREQRRQNQSTYTLYGKKKSAKEDSSICSLEVIETNDVTRRRSSPTNGKKDDTSGSDDLSNNKRKSFSLDSTKRQAFREYHRLGLHLR
jgi:hypothetical protein